MLNALLGSFVTCYLLSVTDERRASKRLRLMDTGLVVSENSVPRMVDVDLNSSTRSHVPVPIISDATEAQTLILDKDF